MAAPTAIAGGEAGLSPPDVTDLNWTGIDLTRTPLDLTWHRMDLGWTQTDLTRRLPCPGHTDRIWQPARSGEEPGRSQTNRHERKRTPTNSSEHERRQTNRNDACPNLQESRSS